MGFADSVKATSKKMLAQTNQHANEVATTLFKRTVELTPVGLSLTRGQLINNWFVGKGIGNYNTSYTFDFNPSASNSYQQISTITGSNEFLEKDGEISLTNSVPYGFRAEYAGWPAPPEGTWTGTVGPYAMIRKSLFEVAELYRK